MTTLLDVLKTAYVVRTNAEDMLASDYINQTTDTDLEREDFVQADNKIYLLDADGYQQSQCYMALLSYEDLEAESK